MSGTDEFPALIYVDLIEEKPLSQSDWAKQTGWEPEYQAAEYQIYLERFQPWRLLIKSGDNQEPLFRSTESYFNREDARHAAELAFGNGSNVYLRQHEKGNQVLRMARQ